MVDNSYVYLLISVRIISFNYMCIKCRMFILWFRHSTIYTEINGGLDGKRSDKLSE